MSQSILVHGVEYYRGCFRADSWLSVASDAGMLTSVKMEEQCSGWSGYSSLLEDTFAQVPWLSLGLVGNLAPRWRRS